MSTSTTPTNIAGVLVARRAKRVENSAKRQGESEKLRLEGNNLFKQGDFVGACNFYVKAIHLQGPKPVLLSNLAAGYLKLGLYEEAEWAASNALDYEPSNLKARYRRAMARKNLKFYSAAAADLEAIVEEDPSQGEANRELEAMYGFLEAGEGLGDDLLERPPEEPYVDDEGKDLSSDSDTSDCLHVGNGIPCRFYNHAGCGRGSECQFSHAPDDRSVRDELGKNVCIKMILEQCKFGNAKCVYSHDPRYIPADSIYADPEKMATARFLQPLLEADIKSNPAAFHGNQGGAHPGRRVRDEFIDDINSMHSQAIKDMPPFKAAASSKVAPNRFILLLSLEDEDFYADICAHVYSALRSKAKVVQAKTTTEATQALASPDLIGVFVTDAGITRRPNRSVLIKLVDYVRAGGVTVLGGMFGNHVTANTMDRFFKNPWGVGWIQGSYHRTTFSVNQQNEIVRRNPSLFSSYSMKALHVGNISPEMAVYSPTENSRLESLVFAPSPIEDKTESPAVTTKVGNGWLSYLGDINAEEKSTNTILAMLGLLDAPHEPVVPPPPPAEAASASASTSVPAAGSSTSTPDPKPLHKGKDKEPEQPPFSASVHKNQHKIPEPQMDGAEPEKKFVLVIILESDKMFLSTHATQVDTLTEKSAIKLGLSKPSSLSHMSSPSLGGVYITDGGLARPENSEVLDAVVQYARDGGSVVIGGLCPTLENRGQLEHIFSAFGLEWEVGTRSTTEIYVNHGHHTANRNGSLPDSYVTEVTSLTSHHPEALLYRQTALGGSQAPIARTHVGQGFVGYIGDHRADSDSTMVLLAMLNLLDGPRVLEPDSQKFVLVLSFSSDSAQQYEEICKDFFADMKTKVEVLHGLSNARVVDLLPSRDLVGVFVTHAAIAYPEQEYLLAKLVEYVKKGGTAVFGGYFADVITITEMLPFLRDNFGLPWDLAGSIDANMVQNPKNEIFKKHPTLPSSFYLEARYIKGIAPSMSLYIPQNRPHVWKPKTKIFQSGAAYADVEKGHVGYLGTTVPDGEVRSILYAMLGIL